MSQRTETPDNAEDDEPCFRVDWDFDGVPESELIACCLWEYARESRTIGMVADLQWSHMRRFEYEQEYQREPSLKAADDERAARIERRAAAADFNYEKFSTIFWKTDFPLLKFYSLLTRHVGEGACAWTDLPADTRTRLAKQVEESDLPPLELATVDRLEQLWNAHRTELEEVRANIKSADDDSEMMVLYAPTEPLHLPEEDANEPSRIVTAAFAVDFSRYNDQEITVAFRDWLATHRPLRWKKPTRVFPRFRERGRKPLEYKVALERLGLMRLLHWHTPAELQRDRPAAWNKYRQKLGSLRREVREARNFFRTLFPFLPRDEVPTSEVRKGVWLSEMMKTVDDYEREVQERGH